MAGERLVWIDADGIEHVLHDSPGGYRESASSLIGLQFGRSGAFMPPVEPRLEPVAGYPGARYRGTAIKERDLDLPLYLREASPEALRQKLRQVMAWFNPLRGDGTGRLRITAPDGIQREIVATYRGGLELEESEDAHGVVWQAAVLVLTAPDPFWTDVADLTSSYVLTASGVAFFPIFPLRLEVANVFAGPTVTNDGDAPAWPVWTITGPGTDPILENTTTGERLSVSGVTLSRGEVLTIDTRPGKKSVTLADGSNGWPKISADSVLWGLRPGANALSLQMGSATTDSSIALAYRRRYLAP